MATLRISLHTVGSTAVEGSNLPVLDLPPVAAEVMTVGVPATVSALAVAASAGFNKSAFVALCGDADMFVSAAPAASPAPAEMFLPAFTQLVFRVGAGNKVYARTA